MTFNWDALLNRPQRLNADWTVGGSLKFVSGSNTLTIDAANGIQIKDAVGTVKLGMGMNGAPTGNYVGNTLIPAQQLTGAARGQHGIFLETFEDNLTGWTSLVRNDLPKFPHTGQAGGKVVECDSGLKSFAQAKIPYDPDKKYRMKARVRRTGAGNVYVGFLGYANDAKTLVSLSGGGNGNIVGDPQALMHVSSPWRSILPSPDASFSEADRLTMLTLWGGDMPISTSNYAAPYWFCAENEAPSANNWTVYTGWFKGTDANASQGVSTDPQAPKTVLPNVKYISPIFWINSDGNSQAELDEISIDIIDDISDGAIVGSMVVEGTLTANLFSANYVEIGGAAADVNNGVTTIEGGKITANSVTVTQLNNSYVDVGNAAADVNDGVTKISGGQIVTNSVTVTQLANNYVDVGTAAADVNGGVTTIDGGKITTNTIVADHITANSITTAKINNLAVDTNKLGDLAVSSGKLGANAVILGKIAANAVTAASIDVNNLSAINANIGNVTAGLIEGVTITGGLFRTDIAGVDRFETTSAGIQRIAANNSITAAWYANDSFKIDKISQYSGNAVIEFSASNIYFDGPSNFTSLVYTDAANTLTLHGLGAGRGANAAATLHISARTSVHLASGDKSKYFYAGNGGVGWNSVSCVAHNSQLSGNNLWINLYGTEARLRISGNNVVGPQEAAVADATNSTDAVDRLNELLARCRNHGLIIT